MAESPAVIAAKNNLRLAIIAVTLVIVIMIVGCTWLIGIGKMSASSFEDALRTLLVGLAGAAAGGLGGWVKGLFQESPGTAARIEQARAEGEKVAYQRALTESGRPPPMPPTE